MLMFINGVSPRVVNSKKEFERIKEILIGDPQSGVTENDFFSVDGSWEEEALKKKMIKLSKEHLLRSEALSYLAIKADQAELGDKYSKIMNTNHMQMLISRWKDTGNTRQAIANFKAITGRTKAVIEKEVGSKGRTIKDYLIYTMASATGDLDLLE